MGRDPATGADALCAVGVTIDLIRWQVALTHGMAYLAGSLASVLVQRSLMLRRYVYLLLI